MNLSDYDFPISHDHYRYLCQLNGEPVPPKLGDLYLPPIDEYRTQFIKWQDKMRQGLPQRVKPIPMQAQPSRPVYKPIIRKPKDSF